MMTSLDNRRLRRTLTAAAVVALSAGLLWQSARSAGEYGAAVPAADTQLAAAKSGTQTMVLAGGCFWGMEEVFQHVKGVTDVVDGYAGGTEAHANYEDSSSGRYGDAEAVRISYDPSRISYTDLLQIYFSVAHDPTQVDRQGPDVGPQYRSEIFAANADQARVVRAYIRQIDNARVYDDPLATKVSVGEHFFPAEAYHQNYAERHPDSLYIRYNDAPKVEALKQRFAQRYRASGDKRTASNG